MTRAGGWAALTSCFLLRGWAGEGEGEAWWVLNRSLAISWMLPLAGSVVPNRSASCFFPLSYSTDLFGSHI